MVSKNLEIELHKLILKSEERIDRTNEMVCKLVSVIDKLTNEYSEKLGKAVDARDKLIEQNKQLITLFETRNREFEVLSKKYDSLIDKLLNNHKSENNINVN